MGLPDSAAWSVSKSSSSSTNRIRSCSGVSGTLKSSSRVRGRVLLLLLLLLLLVKQGFANGFERVPISSGEISRKLAQYCINKGFQLHESGIDSAIFFALLRWFGFSGLFHSKCLKIHTHFVVPQRLAKPLFNSSARVRFTLSAVH